jgi:hypothetical protein
MKEGGILDLDLDEFQLLGTVPVAVIDVLWPGFVPQSYDVYINPVYLRRHLQSRPDYVNRVAAFNQYGHLLATSLVRAHAFARYEGARGTEAGLDVFTQIEDRTEPAHLQLGLRLLPASDAPRRPNYVTTVMLVSTQRVRAVLSRARHCLPDGGPATIKRAP